MSLSQGGNHQYQWNGDEDQTKKEATERFAPFCKENVQEPQLFGLSVKHRLQPHTHTHEQRQQLNICVTT